MSERKIIRTKFIPECNGPEGTPKPQTQAGRSVTVFEYQDGSKDITCSNLSNRTCAISSTGETCVFISGKTEISKVPPVITRRENEKTERGVFVGGRRVKIERRYNEQTREITAQYIQEHDGISRIEIAETFGLDRGMVTRIVQSLLREDKIKEGGVRKLKGKGAGRPVIQLHYNDKYEEPENKTIRDLPQL